MQIDPTNAGKVPPAAQLAAAHDGRFAGVLAAASSPASSRFGILIADAQAQLAAAHGAAGQAVAGAAASGSGPTPVTADGEPPASAGTGDLVSAAISLAGMQGLDGLGMSDDESGDEESSGQGGLGIDMSALLGQAGIGGAGLGAASATGTPDIQSIIAGLTGAGAAGGASLNAPVTSASGPGKRSLQENVRTVAEVARKERVPPEVAVAMMLVESGGDNTAVGDGGTSLGLFQLHEGGMLTSAGLTKTQAFNPATNAGVSLSSLAKYAASRSGSDWGTICAASQRPADPVGYAQKIRDALPRARKLVAGM